MKNGDFKKLRCSNLVKNYDEFSLTVNFEVGKSEIFFICGHNGSGKSTLLRLIGGREFKTSGEVTLEKEGGLINERLHDHVTWIPQNVNDVVANSLLVREIIKLSENPERIRELSSSIGASWLYQILKTRREKKKLVRELSGGQKQLLVGLMALVSSGNVLLLDEVFRSLDDSTMTNYWNMVKGVVKSADKCALVVSHDLDFVAQKSSETNARIMVLRRGEIEGIKTIDEWGGVAELATVAAIATGRD